MSMCDHIEVRMTPSGMPDGAILPSPWSTSCHIEDACASLVLEADGRLLRLVRSGAVPTGFHGVDRLHAECMVADRPDRRWWLDVELHAVDGVVDRLRVVGSSLRRQAMIDHGHGPHPIWIPEGDPDPAPPEAMSDTDRRRLMRMRRWMAPGWCVPRDRQAAEWTAEILARALTRVIAASSEPRVRAIARRALVQPRHRKHHGDNRHRRPMAEILAELRRLSADDGEPD